MSGCRKKKSRRGVRNQTIKQIAPRDLIEETDFYKPVGHEVDGHNISNDNGRGVPDSKVFEPIAAGTMIDGRPVGKIPANDFGIYNPTTGAGIRRIVDSGNEVMENSRDYRTRGLVVPIRGRGGGRAPWDLRRNK